MCFINRIFVKELYFQSLKKQQLNICRYFFRRNIKSSHFH